MTGDFGGNQRVDLLEINVEDPVNRDSRNQRVEGLRLAMMSGGRNTLVVRNRAPNVANIGMVIEGNLISGHATGSGSALRLEGIGTHHLTIRNNQIENGVFLATADGVNIEECLIFGEKTGITLDLIAGAFQTRILRNGIVARDGALRLLNGSQVYFEYNQVEQFAGYGVNRSTQGAHIQLEPKSYGGRHIRIRSNNFGGGDYVRTSIHATGDCQDLLIDDNVFNITSTGTDVVLADANVAWTRIGPNNSARRSGVAQRPNTAGGSIAVFDGGVGSFGVERSGSAMSPIGGSRPGADFRFWKTLDGIVRFEGGWFLSAAGAGGRIATLPVGFRPPASAILVLPSDKGDLVTVRVDASGAVTVLRPGGGNIDWSAASFAAAPRPPYPASDP